MAMIGGVISAIGTVFSMAGTIAAGKARQNAANYEAAQYRQQAKEEVAAAQREVIDKRKQGERLQSRARSIVGKSNLGTLDETVVDLQGDIASEVAYQEDLITYGGENRARGRRAQGDAAELQGKLDMQESRIAAIGQAFSGAASIASSFGSSLSAKYSPVSARPSYNYRYG